VIGTAIVVASLCPITFEARPVTVITQESVERAVVASIAVRSGTIQTARPEAGLSAEIPPADRANFKDVRDGKDWRNPVLTIFGR
jgi:hypothetical protein